MNLSTIYLLLIAGVLSLTGCSRITPKAQKPKKTYVYRKVIVDSPAQCPAFDIAKLKANTEKPIHFPYVEVPGYSVWPIQEKVECEWRTNDRNNKVVVKNTYGYQILGVLTPPTIDTENIEYNDSGHSITIPYELTDIDEQIRKIYENKFHTNKKAPFNNKVNFQRISFYDIFKHKRKAFAFVNNKLATVRVQKRTELVPIIEDDDENTPEEDSGESTDSDALDKPAGSDSELAEDAETDESEDDAEAPKEVKRTYVTKYSIYLQLDENTYSSAKRSIKRKNAFQLFMFRKYGDRQSIASVPVGFDNEKLPAEAIIPSIFLTQFADLSSSTKHKLHLISLLNEYNKDDLVTNDEVRGYFKSSLDFAERRWKQRPDVTYAEDVDALELLTRLRNKRHSCMNPETACKLPKYQRYYSKYVSIYDYFSSHYNTQLERLDLAISLTENPLSDEKLQQVLAFLEILKSSNVAYRVENSGVPAFIVAEQFVTALDDNTEVYQFVADLFKTFANIDYDEFSDKKEIKYSQKQTLIIAKKLKYNAEDLTKFSKIVRALSGMNFYRENRNSMLKNRKLVIKESRKLMFRYKVTEAQVDNLKLPIYPLMYTNSYFYNDDYYDYEDDYRDYPDDDYPYGGESAEPVVPGEDGIDRDTAEEDTPADDEPINYGTIESLNGKETYYRAKLYAVIKGYSKEKIETFNEKLIENVKLKFASMPDEENEDGFKEPKHISKKQFVKIINLTEELVFGKDVMVDVSAEELWSEDNNISEEEEL